MTDFESFSFLISYFREVVVPQIKVTNTDHKIEWKKRVSGRKHALKKQLIESLKICGNWSYCEFDTQIRNDDLYCSYKMLCRLTIDFYYFASFNEKNELTTLTHDDFRNEYQTRYWFNVENNKITRFFNATFSGSMDERNVDIEHDMTFQENCDMIDGVQYKHFCKLIIVTPYEFQVYDVYSCNEHHAIIKDHTYSAIQPMR